MVKSTGQEPGDEALLEKVSAAFAPYLLSSHDRNNVRRSIRHHIAAQIGAPETRRQDLKGLRGEYVKAVRANRAARRRCDSLLGHRVSPADEEEPSSAVGSADMFGQHVELRRLQRQHTTLVALRDELDGLRHSSRRFVNISLDIRPSVIASEAMSAQYPGMEPELARLVDELTRWMKGVERAVVEAHRHAIQERSLLTEAKSHMQDELEGGSASRRLFALSATRRELTAWLEESLEKCQGGRDETKSQEEQQPERTTNLRLNLTDSESESEQLIDSQYEQYIDARRRLLAVVSSLKASPLQEQVQTTHDTNATSEQMTRPSKEVGWFEGIDVLNLIEQTLLPVFQQRITSRALLAFAKERQEDEMTATANMLDRLSDESQILQAFPLLARSGRFEHAASALGKKHAVADEPKDGLSRLLEPWLFAAEAAEIASSSTVEGLLKQSKDSMEDFARSLAELSLLHGGHS